MASEIERLRAEVRRRQQAANAKVSRLRRNKNVDVAGTQFDVRRDPKLIARYNSRQLNDYLTQLNSFTHRKTQFVASNKGQPIPTDRLRKSEALIEQHNQTVRKMYGQVKNYINPDQNMTVETYDKDVRADKIAAAGRGSHRPFNERKLNIKNVNGIEGLDALDRDIRRRNVKTFGEREIKKQRQTALKMLNVIGNPGYIRRFRNLSDHQFNTIFNYMNFAEDMSMKYLSVSGGHGTNLSEEFAAQIEESNAVDYWLDFAQRHIPRDAPEEGTFSVWDPTIDRRKKRKPGQKRTPRRR